MNKKIIWIVLCTIIVGAIFIIVVKKTDLFSNSNINLTELSKIGENDIILGDYNATNSIILFYNYNCKFCVKFFNEVYPELNKEYINKGKLNIILKLVCNPTDKAALKAYQTVVCINKFGNFQKLHKLLLYKGEIIYTNNFKELEEEYINTNNFVGECMMNSNGNDIKKNISQFQKVNTRGTPTFIIGKQILKGYKSFERLSEIIDSEFNLNANKKENYEEVF